MRSKQDSLYQLTLPMWYSRSVKRNAAIAGAEHGTAPDFQAFIRETPWPGEFSSVGGDQA
jgi:hypothetical protein